MIKSIVFDMGNVLIVWDTEYYVARAGITDPADAALLLEAVYHSPEWTMLDAGALNEDQVLEIACSRLPDRLHDDARRLVFGWTDPIAPVPGMKKFVLDCKNAGYGAYLLSNASHRQKDYWPDIPGSEYFDGRVVSAEVNCMKPQPGIYLTLLRNYGLKAEECVFIDDIPANVEGARRVGMQGIVFDGNVEKLREEIKGFGVKL